MKHLGSAGRNASRRTRRGTAVVEFAITAFVMLLMLFGIIDFGRALLARHAITSLSREAANLESRGTPMQETIRATLLSSGSINLALNGYVILTAVSRDEDGNLRIVRQMADGGVPSSSKIGTAGSPGVRLPEGVPLPSQTLYVAEIFVNFSAVTPIANLIDRVLPTSLYDVAYF